MGWVFWVELYDRGMIKDSFDPVYYSSVQRIKNKTNDEIKSITLKYKQALDLPNGYETIGEMVKDELKEITTFYCIDIPGETKWVEKEYKLKSHIESNNSSNNKACLVKVYDNFENYRINEIYEFIGVLCKDSSSMQDEFKLENEQNTDDLTIFLHSIKSINLNTNNPLLARFNQNHLETDAIEPSKLASEIQNNYWNIQYHSFLKNLLKQANALMSVEDSNCINVAHTYLNKLRNEIITIFQELLLGDALAAEYLLMHLLSSVFLRKDVTILGKFSLNITNIPKILPKEKDSDKDKNFADCLFNSLSQFITMGQVFKLSIDNLNKSNLIPSKDYSRDKIISGMLQLPDHFEFVIDETVLNAGELKQKGLMNLNSIKEIINWQKLNYDFGFNQQEFNTNMRVLVLSETKSILPFDVQLKLNHNLTHFDSEKYESNTNHLFDETKIFLLNNMRKYFSILSCLDYKLTQPMQQIVENDFVQMRQKPLENANEKMSMEDFHLLLVIARLQTLSYGKSELGLDEWSKAKTLEFERIKRK